MNPNEDQFRLAKDAQETTRWVSKFPTLLNAGALQRLNKEEGYEFPFSGDELAKIKAKENE